jgi:hypothetical protein
MRLFPAVFLFFLMVPCQADEVTLGSGEVLRGLAREKGILVEVVSDQGTRTVTAREVDRILWRRPETWLTRPPEWPDEVDSLPDLDVTCIEILPRRSYPLLSRVFVRSMKKPSLPAPKPGQYDGPATFVAHVRNRGTAQIHDVRFTFFLDGQVERRDRIRRIAPGQRLTFVLMRRRAATAAFEVETAMDERNREISQGNNRLAVRRDAVPVWVGAPAEVVRSFDFARNMTGSFSFEDWVRDHVRQAERILRTGGGPHLRIDGFVTAKTPEAFAERLVLPNGKARFRAAGLYVALGVAPGSVDALAVRWNLVRDLVRSVGLSDPRPFLPDLPQAFKGLLTTDGAAPLSEFSRRVLAAYKGRFPLPCPVYLLDTPAKLVLTVHDSRGRPVESIRLLTGDEEVFSGVCDLHGRVTLRKDGPPWVVLHGLGRAAPLHPFGLLVLAGRGWLHLKAQTPDGTEGCALTLPSALFISLGGSSVLSLTTRKP